MLLLNKYRVHEVAKDFGLNSKDIADIMTKYFTTPKNHMQVLEQNELAVIFDYLTQHHQVESIESIFADVYHEPADAKKPEQAPAQPKAAAAEPQKSAAGASSAPQQGQKPQQQAAQKPQQGAPLQKPTTRVPEKKLVDTRQVGNVNLEKYD
ncbi:MAG: translation initiation factor IF-2, partial [Oscillospiraceae bacterium]|nr:translation initiation factor IF-2 [Oscillospiraceae bacterium]